MNDIYFTAKKVAKYNAQYFGKWFVNIADMKRLNDYWQETTHRVLQH